MGWGCSSAGWASGLVLADTDLTPWCGMQFFAQVTCLALTLTMYAHSSHAQSHALTSMHMSEVPNSGSHTFVWTHDSKAQGQKVSPQRRNVVTQVARVWRMVTYAIHLPKKRVFYRYKNRNTKEEEELAAWSMCFSEWGGYYVFGVIYDVCLEAVLDFLFVIFLETRGVLPPATPTPTPTPASS